MRLQTLRHSEVGDIDCADLIALRRSRVEVGAAILMIDGLDEIREPVARARLAERVEQIHRSYPQTFIIVTSRIVGYREMGYRIGGQFQHLTMADFSRNNKEEFARGWSALVEPPGQQVKAAEEFIREIHSNDRIEQLTSSPLLLTTMALIRRRVGRLPQRRGSL
jgi:predicted NACHT family NTPase